jgi:hypothetical protein
MPDKGSSWEQLTLMPGQLEIVKGEMRKAAHYLSNGELQAIIDQ